MADDGPTGGGTSTTPASTSPSGWLPPPTPAEGSRRGLQTPLLVGCLLVVAVFLIGPLIAVAVLDSTGANGPSVHAVEFGTGGSGCTVTGAARSIPQGTLVYAVAMFSPELQTGSSVVVKTFRDGTEVVGLRQFVPVEEPSDCVFVGMMPPTPGRYRVEFALDPSPIPPLAGEFEVTAN
jgi:hypothetical protein